MLIVNLGLGVDSVAMLVGLAARSLRPDHILFADTGSEKPETYAYLPVLAAFLARVGFPAVTVVRRGVGRAGYASLEENCLANETLPSLAFGRKSCSLKWKAEAMDRYLLGTRRRPGALALKPGERPLKLIGYDCGPRDSRRAVDRVEDAHFRFAYPLRDWGWTRERCIEEIVGAGLPVPMKSACYFCPASQPWELLWLAAQHPRLFVRALQLEDCARRGRHGLRKVRGLWGRDTAKRPGSWRAWAEREGIVVGDAVVADPAALMERVRALKPAAESDGAAFASPVDDLVQIRRTTRPPPPQLGLWAA